MAVMRQMDEGMLARRRATARSAHVWLEARGPDALVLVAIRAA